MLAKVIILFLMVFSLGISAAEHGKPKKGNHNFFTDLLSTAVTLGLFYWAGFFNN